MPSSSYQRGLTIWLTLFVSLISLCAENKPLLWRVEGTKPSFLFGTIHSPDPRVSTLNPIVEEVLLDSDGLFTELRFDVETMQKAMRLMVRDGDASLKELLGDSLYSRLDETLKNISPLVSAQLFEKAEIWSIFLSLSLLEHQLKFPGRAALDLVLWHKAQEHEIFSDGLETPEEQVQGMKELTLQEQIRILEESLDVYQEYQTQRQSPLEDLVEAYLSGDIEAIGKEMENQVDLEDPINRKLFDFLLIERNERMASRIHETITTSSDSSFFFAVGAAHFWGEQSILEILRQKGLAISRVQSASLIETP